MRYFFDTNKKCIAIVTENPTNTRTHPETVNTVYSAEGDVGRDPNNAFLDGSGIVRGRNSVTITARSSPGYCQISFSVTAAWYPAYVRVSGRNTNYTSVTKDYVINSAGQIVIDSGWYPDMNHTVSVNTEYGDGASVGVYACDCYSCDCGGGN